MVRVRWEGWFFQTSQNCVKDSVQIFCNVCIPEPDDAKPVLIHIGRSRRIMAPLSGFGVLAAIKLDDQFGF